jgi:pyridoxal 5'-phosphate synthase pdxT subunit
MKIGVLALQGDFAEHLTKLSGIGVQPVAVRLPEQLQELDGLIMPGGESTTLGKLATAYGLMDGIREFGRRHAIWGTCAGAILMASEVFRDQPILRLMDIAMRRNAFGRQVDSFEIGLTVPALVDPARPFHAIFIRAPIIDHIGPGVEILARLPDDIIVAARQDRFLATCFHPELTQDDRFHRLFARMATRSVPVQHDSSL